MRINGKTVESVGVGLCQVPVGGDMYGRLPVPRGAFTNTFPSWNDDVLRGMHVRMMGVGANPIVTVNSGSKIQASATETVEPTLPGSAELKGLCKTFQEYGRQNSQSGDPTLGFDIRLQNLGTIPVPTGYTFDSVKEYLRECYMTGYQEGQGYFANMTGQQGATYGAIAGGVAGILIGSLVTYLVVS